MKSKLHAVSGLLIIAIPTLLTSCMSKKPRVDPICAGATTPSKTYFNLPSECENASGGKACAPELLILNDRQVTCYAAKVDSNLNSDPNAAPALSFAEGAINLGTINAAQTASFKVRNQGGEAKACKIVISSNPTAFAPDSTLPFSIPGGITSTFYLKAKHVPNLGSQSGTFKIECQNQVVLDGGSIQAIFGEPGINTRGSVSILAFDASNSYSVPAFIRPNAPYLRTLKVTNTGTADAQGCRKILEGVFSCRRLVGKFANRQACRSMHLKRKIHPFGHHHSCSRRHLHRWTRPAFGFRIFQSLADPHSSLTISNHGEEYG